MEVFPHEEQLVFLLFNQLSVKFDFCVKMEEIKNVSTHLETPELLGTIPAFDYYCI